MLATILQIWEFIKIIWGILDTVLDFIKIAVNFTFGMLHSVFSLVSAVYTGGLLWLGPVVGLSLGIGWLLLILNRR